MIRIMWGYSRGNRRVCGASPWMEKTEDSLHLIQTNVQEMNKWFGSNSAWLEERMLVRLKEDRVYADIFSNIFKFHKGTVFDCVCDTRIPPLCTLRLMDNEFRSVDREDLDEIDEA